MVYSLVFYRYVFSFLYLVFDTFQALLPQEQGLEIYMSNFIYLVVAIKKVEIKHSFLIAILNIDTFHAL